MKKIKGNGKALKKKGAKTDTNKGREETVAFCVRERGAGGIRAETSQEDFTAPELSKLHRLHQH